MTDTKGRAAHQAQALGPDSLLQEYCAQLRWILAVVRAAVLEAAHPQIGAALLDNSTFVAHPWRRLFNTVASTRRLTGDDAKVREREADRLSRLHGRISGTDSQGRTYDAMDPDVRAWVVAALFESTVLMCRLGGDPLDSAAQGRLYQDFRALFVTLGDDGSHLPDTLQAFWPYYNDMIVNGLENTGAVHAILYRLFAEVPPPPLLRNQPAVWAAVRAVAGPLATAITVASLPESYRRQAYLSGMPGSRVLMHGAYLSAGLATRLLSGVGAQANAIIGALAPVDDADPGRPALDVTRAAAERIASALRAFTPAVVRTEPPARRQPDAPIQLSARRSAERFFTEVLDQSGDGHLSWPDLAAMAREIATRLDLDAEPENQLFEAYAAWWRELNSLDGDGDGRLTREEYARAAPTMAGPALIRIAEILFDAVDSDDDQIISQDEYRTLFRTAFSHEETGGDGEFSRSDFIREFLNFMAGRHHSAGYQRLLVDA